LTLVQAYKKEPLHFSGNWDTLHSPISVSTARLTDYLSEWAVLHDRFKNQAYNSIDSNSMTFERFSAELARWYGNENVAVGRPEDLSKFEFTESKGGS
jgi:hypothetical protein